MEQIQIRFELIFELMEELGYDSWMDAKEYKRLFYGIRNLQNQMMGWLDIFKNVSENATDAFDKRNITWASDLMQCRTAYKMITRAFETSISRIDWIIEKIDEVSSVENNDVSYKLETPVVQNEEPVLNNDEHEDVHFSTEEARTELPVEQNKSLGRKIFVIIAKVLICIICTVTAIMGFGFLISSMPGGALICWAITAGLIFVAGKIK